MSTRNLLLLIAAVGLGSCSTIYKSGQTPDDVYYSPAPQQRAVASNNNDSDEYYADEEDGDYVNVSTDQDRNAYSGEDNYLRMKVRNRSMWSSLDYYDAMAYSPYGGGFGWGGGMGMYNPYMMNSFYSPWGMGGSRFGLGMGMGMGFGGMGWGYNSMFNPYFNSFHNPYYGGGWYGGGHYLGGVGGGRPINVKPASTFAPRTSNLGRYGGASRNGNVNTSGRNAPVRVFRNNNDNNYVNPRSSGNTSRRSVDNGSSNSNSRPSRTYESRSSEAPSRSYTPSSSSGGGSSRSSGGGGGSAPSRSPGRGGR